ncbi:hypothetical protein [Paenibacillus sp. OV219]|uniref:hypothetical protein n=1 Tax=Paenibacillus sp. OV219 TaxID=1884377 RepID=UPI0008D173CC|nr:hypothetical protein [Paenibacillus sp. OV219]SEN78121.1 hypothetical protein SAMN05518847_104123 [Paenibacillus sp. OV219]
MNEKHEDHAICPWCHTEIVWDEEIGPERNCPHCENELSGYRTLQIGMELEDEETDTVDSNEQEDDTDWEEEYEDEGEGEGSHSHSHDLSELRPYNRDQLALEETMNRILDDQLEAPECPSCREFMIEAGTQTVKEKRFTPKVSAALGEPILEAPFELVLYVCPSCFHTQNRLSVKGQERLVSLLSKATNLED